MRLALRYDMRAPTIGAPAADLYAASIEQAAWADRLGFETVYLAEHHGADDGYSPAPMIQAAAMMGVTTSIRAHFSALLIPLHDPIRLAEDLAILDLVSRGRIEITAGLGYRPHEYRMFGVDRKRRVAVFEDALRLLQLAWTGEPFEYRNETIVVRPRPYQRPRPPIYIGGSAPASALRAARFGDGYLPATAGLWEIYEQECVRLGRAVGPLPPAVPSPLFLHVSDDPERDWHVVAPHVLYTAQSNSEWAKERGVGATPYPAAASVAELVAHSRIHVLTPDECVQYMLGFGETDEVQLQPLMGGLPTEVGWAGLQLFEHKVLPRLIEAGRRPAPARDGH